MKDKVLIRVKSETYSDEAGDCLEINYIGEISRVNGNIYVQYEEMTEGESRMTKNLVKIYPDKGCVAITKRGPITAHMEFCTGQRTHTFYETPFGAVNMGIYTREADIDASGESIKILLDYSIESNYQIVSECRVSMEIKGS